MVIPPIASQVDNQDKNEWCISRLVTQCEIISKGTTPTTIGQAFQSHGITFFKIESIGEDGTIIDHKIAYINEYTHKLLSRSHLRKNDILFSIAGALGRVTLVLEKHLPANTNQALAFIRLKTSSEIDNNYLIHYLRSKPIQNHIQAINVQAAQANISLQNVRDFGILHPDLVSQRTIAAVINDVDTLISELERLIAKKRDLKQAAMQQLLTGQRRLPGFIGEWERRRLGDVAMTNMGQSPDSKNYNRTGQGLPLIQGNADIERRMTIRRVWTTQTTKVCDATDLILTVRAPVGEIAIASGRSCLGRGVCSLKPIGVDAQFLFHALVFAEKDWRILEQGSTFTSANSAQIASFSLPVAPSSAEQSAIATVLSDMDTELAALESRRDKTRDLKQGMMQELLTGRIRLV